MLSIAIYTKEKWLCKLSHVKKEFECKKRLYFSKFLFLKFEMSDTEENEIDCPICFSKVDKSKLKILPCEHSLWYNLFNLIIYRLAIHAMTIGFVRERILVHFVEKK